MNAKGGRWLFTINNQDVKLDDLWLETLLGMIGDCFSQDAYVLKNKRRSFNIYSIVEILNHSVDI
jgi:hypothetical protein